MHGLGKGAGLGLSLVLVTLLSPAPVSACSGRDGGSPGCVTRVRRSHPQDGGVDLPTNVQFSLTALDGPSPMTVHVDRVPIVARASDGARVSLTRATSGMFAPDSELDPHTEYVLYDAEDPSVCGETDPSVLVEVARFTTGAGPDHDPPAAPVVRGVSACSTDSCDSSACCGPYSFTSWGLDFDRSTDLDVIGYRMAEGGEARLRFGEWLGYPVGQTLVIHSAVGPTGLSIVAMDHAGNLSTPTPPIDASRCAPADDADAGPGRDATATAGCTCAASSPARGSIMPLLVLAMVALARARRRRAAPGR